MIRDAARQMGVLVLIGGREDETGPHSFLRRIVELNDAREISVIPSASKYPWEIAAKYERAFARISGREIRVLDIRYPDEADDEQYLEAVDSSDLIFFTGGDQVRLVEALGRDSELLRRIKARHHRGATIAGTSAGAAAASDPMIFDGGKAGLYKGRVRHRPGLGFLPRITIDTHFVKRHRISRLAQALSSGLSKRGIGLGENTALFIYPDGIAEVVGSGWVTVLDSERMHYSNFDEVEEDGHLSVAGLRVGFLAAGTRFNLRRWRVVS